MFYSPLRYPGGKGKLCGLIEILIEEYGHLGGTYIEPFAGGAGVAIELLEKGVVSSIVINDFDKGIYSFWRAILTDTEKFISTIRNTPVNITEWKKQRAICLNDNKKYSFKLGFATFYMNRTNRSGIIKGGVIGGQDQSGIWKMDARFNKDDLIARIEKIASMKKSIHLYNKDVESFIKNYAPKYEDNAFIYFDPPYFDKGKQLYLNFFDYDDHVRIESLIKSYVTCDWIITYDDAPEIATIYSNRSIRRFNLTYTVAKKRRAQEIMIFESENKVPSNALLEKKGLRVALR